MSQRSFVYLIRRIDPRRPSVDEFSMRYHVSCACALAILLSAVFTATVSADQPVPANLLDPKSAREAWNVIRLVTQNVGRMIEEKRASEIPVQISYCSPALRALPRLVNEERSLVEIPAEAKQALSWVNAIAGAAKSNDLTLTKSGFRNFRTVLTRMERHFDPSVVSAEIYSCPMHAEVISENARTPCEKCGVKLLPRRIPYSAIYTTPGQSTIRLTVRTSAPVEAGKSVEVTIRLEQPDKSPVRTNDLMETHTERIHLLIEEPGLSDYHHEHPVPTKTPGDYRFTFTPRKSAPYRIWADLVPLSTGVQEMPFVDLPSTEKAVPVTSGENRYASTAGGYQFSLTFAGGEKAPLTAQQTRTIAIMVQDALGNPVTNLEPVMNAFAHLVGFHSDYQTVVHLHPTGGEILNPKFRGGPALGFLFYPPKTGLLRLYCQVRIGGKMIFAPFTVNVEPWCAPPGQ